MRGQVADASELGPLLARDGVVLFRHGTPARLLHLLEYAAEVRLHPHGTVRGETVIEPRPSPGVVGGAGFSRLALAPHTDRALTPRPPTLVAVLIERAAPVGGHSLLADARALSLPAPAKFRSLMLEAGSAGAYPIFESSAGLIRIRYREDDVARPHAARAEDRTVLSALRALGARAEVCVLGDGEGYLAHNCRVLHGRTAFRGYRRATRYLADLRSAHPYAWMNEGFLPKAN
ncbi:TauD/TfdA family dioxygenase [Actinospica durhamensis]|uniref:TauD/TfdA family dioxygenase n=1 Tax=Actinospica durhamensis TaxID=1508375 RepID=A0A941ITG8_9ACTN|nr:TauD/TfdA family dioxygenase [Actinospica durhamensis]MBR7839759.1 TauD/TfdA family dioxygenase [Actinospica durhamensis]